MNGRACLRQTMLFGSTNRLHTCLLLSISLFVLAGQSTQGSTAQQDSAETATLDLTLQNVIILALRNNRLLENSRLNRSVERFALTVAEDEFRPRFTLEPYADRSEMDQVEQSSGIRSAIRLRIPTGGEFALSSRISNLHEGSPTLASHSGLVDLTFVQPLLRGGGFKAARASLHSARLKEEVNVLYFEDAVMSLITRAVRTYRAYIQAQRRNDIALRSLKRAEELLEVNRLLVQAGRMADRDVIQTEADIARRELDVLSSQVNLDASRLDLVDVLDLDTETYFNIAVELGEGQPGAHSVNIDEALKIALLSRPDHQIGVLGVNDAEYNVEVSQNRRLWDLSLSVGRTFSASDDEFSDTINSLEETGNRVRLELEVPVGRTANGQRQLQHRQAIASLEIAKNNLADLRQRIAIEVRNAVRDVELAEQRVQIAKKAKSLTQEKAEIEREKLNLGVTTNFQLVAFENDLVVAENAELDALVNHLNASTLLDQTLGTTLDRWGIEIEKVEHSQETGERFGITEGGSP